MFERFMVDDLRHWATTYKVGGGAGSEEEEGKGGKDSMHRVMQHACELCSCVSVHTVWALDHNRHTR
jgi:hypothetical protein